MLQKLGAAEAGYYFVAFQIAALLNSVSTAVGEAVFAEVSSDPSGSVNSCAAPRR
ncbi:hypothetical protein ACR3S4_00015 [Streptomyces sp. CH8.1]|uniref:hypothetical protein n=1 Tax=Streptomyces sp. CH8.1 TaxID=3439546 RepID=UPI003DA1AA4E